MRYFVTVAVTALSLLTSGDAISKTDIPGDQLAQNYGVVCSTPWGSCQVPPQPMGSVCFCGGAQGFIAQ